MPNKIVRSLELERANALNKKLGNLLDTIEGFSHAHSNEKEKAGRALILFMTGNCEHLFQKDGFCELCNESV